MYEKSVKCSVDNDIEENIKIAIEIKRQSINNGNMSITTG